MKKKAENNEILPSDKKANRGKFDLKMTRDIKQNNKFQGKDIRDKDLWGIEETEPRWIFLLKTLMRCIGGWESTLESYLL